jgi:antitoxin PrlF
MVSYRAKATTVGHSKALRLDRALFQAHPEFATGEFKVSVLGPGAMLVTAKTPASREPADADPVLEAYLAFLEQQMVSRPESIRPLTTEDVRGLERLLADVVIDRDEELPDDFELP